MVNQKTKNIVISGTNMWNPGDDFVRDGVIRLLHELFAGYQLNFLFYNFNQDFFPQNKFSGVTNMVSKGDLEQYRDFIDYVVIAGLSAGAEIKDLYKWVIDNRLEDRVYLIGAGYENSYVERYIGEEPEATIFRNARLITGRTRKTPNFISELNLPYHHINCPALLSVPTVKQIQPGKKISRIALSLQLPHEMGIVNHCCSQAMYELGLKILIELKKNFDVEVIAHHKSEYFHFLHVLKDFDIPVIFSSFYHDLFEIYPRFDLVVTTRLHSSLFANGFGIPGIIINDTDRHTHCLEGFPHSVWVNSLEAFLEAFASICVADLHGIAKEADQFKMHLVLKYLDVLRGPFGLPEPVKETDMSVERLITRIGATEVKSRVLAHLMRLTPDQYLTRNVEVFRKAVQGGETWFDSPTFLNWFAATFKPANYLEVGVRRGRSMAQVIVESPATHCFGFDMWIPDYSGVENPGPEFVLNEFRRLGAQQLPVFIKGNSHETLPAFWANPQNPQSFDLIFIDGDHSYEGAKQDLDLAFAHLAPGGALLFDDISHPSHLELYPLWNEYKKRYPEFIFIEDLRGNGTACAFKPPFKHLKNQVDPADLPIHFFTIVLNGEPFIRHHINVFKKLPVSWHWHIIEGVADLKHDTAWSLAHGGRITNELHDSGRSNDGTSDYLDWLAREYPNNVTIYRKPPGVFWDGKLEMVNSPLPKIYVDCLLWQVDADELWTADQIVGTHKLFMSQPNTTAAFFLCHYFVGERLITTTRNTYGNYTDFEWLRCWRYNPGDSWQSHEPPKLCRKQADGKWADLATLAPLRHATTEAAGLVFQHFAYATTEQLRFKEVYYGYQNAVLQWQVLQSVAAFPVHLKNYFGWVNDEAMVNTVDSQGVVPLAFRTAERWSFGDANVASSGSTKILIIRTDAIGDAILASPLLEQIHGKYSDPFITVLCQHHIKELYENCPYVGQVLGFDKNKAYDDGEYRTQVLQQLKSVRADIVLNAVYSREWLTDFFASGADASEGITFIGDLSNISAKDRENGNLFYSRLIESTGLVKPELERYKDFLAGLGIYTDQLVPVLYLSSEDHEFADRYFIDNGLVPEKTIALFAGAQQELKNYGSYGSALSKLCESANFSVIALGDTSSAGINKDNLLSINTPRYDLCGRLSLRQSAAIIKKCRLAVGADTSLAHVACAVGTPNVILLGGGHFGRFLPYSPLTSVVCLPLECYDCNWRCRYDTPYCIQGVQVEVLQQAIQQSLDNPSGFPRIFAQNIDRWHPPPQGPMWRQITKYALMTGSKTILI